VQVVGGVVPVATANAASRRTGLPDALAFGQKNRTSLRGEKRVKERKKKGLTVNAFAVADA
jgi:hypothetical protein